MTKMKYIAVFLLAGIVIAMVAIFFRQDGEPAYHEHCLGYWVDMYGKSYPDQRNPEDVEALTAIGTNALPFLINWIRSTDAKPSHARNVVLSILNHLPKFIEPGFLISWADEHSFYGRDSQRAGSAAVTFLLLGTNAIPSIPDLKAILANPTNGYACVEAERALTRIGPEGFAAVLEVIAIPGLPQRGALMQGDAMHPHLAPPSGMLPGQADPNYRINSKRAAPVLLICLEDNDVHVQRLAIMLLSSSDPDSMVPALTNFLQGSPQPEIRRQATEALAAYGHEARVAVPFLLSRCSDSDPEIRSEATNALIQIAPESLPNGHSQ